MRSTGKNQTQKMQGAWKGSKVGRTGKPSDYPLEVENRVSSSLGGQETKSKDNKRKEEGKSKRRRSLHMV